MTVINDYEQERLANIASNEALMREIGLTDAKILLPKKPSTPKPLKKKRKIEANEPVTRRTSSRLSGIPADSEIARDNQEQRYKTMLEEQNTRRRRVSGPIELNDVMQSNTTWTDAKSMLDTVAMVRLENDEDKAATRDLPGLKAVTKEMGGLSLLEKWDPNAIKLTPERIYSIGMHPGSEKFGFAGDKLGNLGIWDIEGSDSQKEAKNEDENDADAESPRIHHFKIHSRAITSFGFDTITGQRLYSGSYDCSIRALDLITGQAIETWVSDDDSAVTSIDISLDSRELCFATLNGEVGLKDLRSTNVDIYRLHDRKITSISIQPMNPNILCSASLDRSMKLWDTRKLVGPRKDRRPTLLAEYACSLSVSSAYFNSTGSVVATSFDNTIKVFDSSQLASWPNGLATPIEPRYSLTHNNQTGRWLTVFKANWQKTPLDSIPKIVVGNMKRMVDVIGTKANVLAQLQDERITAVPAVVSMHDSHNWIIAGNASGKALFFS